MESFGVGVGSKGVESWEVGRVGTGWSSKASRNWEKRERNGGEESFAKWREGGGEGGLAKEWGGRVRCELVSRLMGFD